MITFPPLGSFETFRILKSFPLYVHVHVQYLYTYDKFLVFKSKKINSK